MKPAPRSLDEFRGLLAEAGFDESRVVVEHTGTICPAGEVVAGPLGELRVLLGAGAKPAELEMKARIGQGGMGEVRLAVQLALQRDVAVKCAVPGATSRHEAAAALLQEARVMGALEHPNIVPVHALGRTDDGGVLIVMKRIEGTVWADLLKERGSCAADLERHLQILMEVCRAVHFAHTRGVVHRDLKPQNVMVGSFDEVYVLDWGIAVRTASVGGARPAGVNASSLAGTPAYMAPEMAVPGSPVDGRTDVYLLGGILHTIATGGTPHQGVKVSELLHQAFLSSPKAYGDDVPSELAGICRRALARDPADRFASADELRLAIAEFRSHASARVLAHEAGARLASFARVIESGDDLVVHRAFGEIRFGFEQALRTWPGSPEASDGLKRALSAMAGYEITRRHVDAARVLVDEIDAPAQRLVDDLAALRADLAREAEGIAHAAAVVRDVDARPGQRRRALVFFGCAIGWGCFGVLTGVLTRGGVVTIGYLDMVLAHLGVISALLAGRRWARDDSSRASRAIYAGGVMMVAGVGLNWLIVWAVKAPLFVGLALSHVMMGIIAALIASVLDKRAYPSAILFLVGVPLIVLAPVYAFEINALVVMVALSWAAWIWRR